MSQVRLHRRPPARQGFVPVVQAGKDLKYLSFGLLRLDTGESYRLETAGEEAVVVLLRGSLRVSGAGLGGGRLGPRRNVFDNKASAAYVPPGTWVDIQADDGVEAAIVSATVSATSLDGQAALVTPDQVRVQLRGKPGFQREVHDIVDSRIPARRLLVGETFNRPGEWSSYPPHKHDELIPGVEYPLEEVYYFRIDPPQGFGVQVIYSPTKGVDESYRVLDGDVTILPFGYHPVAAAPGYRLYYLWALAGEVRQFSFNDDPVHAWLR